MSPQSNSFHLLSDEEKLGLLEARSDRSVSESDSEISIMDMENLRKPSKWLMTATAPLGRLRGLPWGQLLVRFLIFLIPSFLHGRLSRDPARAAKLYPTAYLDGMRGLAALFVYFCHYFYQAFTIAEGYGAGDKNYHLLKLPFLRLWYQGPAAVCVFFIISGYALSYRPLKLMRSGSSADFSTTMSSLTFRRLIRLYVPTAISTLFIVFLLRIGAYDLTREFANDRRYHKNIMEPHPIPMATLYEQLCDWANQMYKFVHIWDWDQGGGRLELDVHLWTIPMEYRCSLALFLVLIATARLRTIYRFMFVLGVTAMTYWGGRWDLLLFLAGMILAENDLARGAHVPEPALPHNEKRFHHTRGQATSFYWGLISIIGLYLLCQPDGRGEITPGWVTLTSLIPKGWKAEPFRFWQSIGAVTFIYAVGHSPGWQRFFNSNIVQYFGKISYAIYLMHGPAMHTVGYHWEKWAYSITGVEGLWFNAGFVLGACFCIPTVVWWADVFWRAVDIPTVQFAKWFESKLLAKHH